VAQAGEINNGRYLDQLPDKIRDTVGTSVGTDAWGLQRDVFLAGLGELIKSLPAPKVVPADKLKEAQDKYQGAIIKIGEKEKEAAVLKQQIADLEKCKDKDEGNAVARKYSTTQEQFEKLVQSAKNALGKVHQITATALFAEQAGHPCFLVTVNGRSDERSSNSRSREGRGSSFTTFRAHSSFEGADCVARIN